MTRPITVDVSVGPHARPGVVEQRVRGEHSWDLRFHWTEALDTAADLADAAVSAAAADRVPAEQVESALDRLVARIRGRGEGQTAP